MPEHPLQNVSSDDSDSFFFHEMMAHPALFTHPAPQKIAIIGQTAGILPEALKHAKVREICCIDPHLCAENDDRIQHHSIDSQSWLTNCPDESYDIIIQTNPIIDDFKHFHRILESDGIFVNPCPVSLLDIWTLKALHEKLKDAGFHALQTLNFAQPSHPTRWRLLIMATKLSAFRSVREKDVFNRRFTTRYYNYDIHKAALALPEFVTYLFNSDKL